jgi:hypothetical protein
MLRVSLWALCLLAASADGLLGCSACDKEDEAAVVVTGEREGLTWWTNRPDEPRIHFPAGRRLELQHGLSNPVAVQINVAFSAVDGNESPSAGNETLIDWDYPRITIRNDTCEKDFYVHVVVTGVNGEGGAPSDGGAFSEGGAGG